MPATVSARNLEFALIALVLGMGVFVLLGSGCTSEFPLDDLGIVEPIQATEAIVGADGQGSSGPRDEDYSSTAVWDVRHSWHDVTDEAGIAWQADSGLTWNQKYQLWIDGLGRVDAHASYYETFEITTPTGKVLPSPSLECAEMGYFLRSLFASWYGLPFYVAAVDGNGSGIYLGHFGFVTRDGKRYGNTPKFSKYADYSGWDAGKIEELGWPSDPTLRGREIYGSASDAQPFLGEDAHFGAYLDELLLNKRTGYFLLILLPYFGSVNLADDGNTYHVKPEAVAHGDVLLERWQRTGIGHTLVVKEVQWIDGGNAVVELASGSMPRRQAKWESSTGSKMYFTSRYTGGEGTNSDGHAYVDLGGGLKRFLAPEVIGGRWYNNVSPDKLDEFIPTSDKDARAARPGQFETLLATVSDEELLEELLIVVEDKRAHLRNHPASCSARIAREDAFDKVYEVGERLGMSRTEIDAEYRTLEDYVFAELVYDESKTCCWNSTTHAMYEIIMDYNLDLTDTGDDTCEAPVVFKAEDGGYELFAEHAATLGRADEWVAWSEDESCPQAGVSNDTEELHAWTDFCDIDDHLVGDPGDDPGDEPGGDAFEPNDSIAEAVAAAVDGAIGGLTIHSSSDEDFFRVEPADGQLVSVVIAFQHGEGDLDLEILDAAGEHVSTSQGTSDEESITVTGPGPFFARVYGYSGATAAYQLAVEVENTPS